MYRSITRMRQLLSVSLCLWCISSQAQTRKDLIGCWSMPGLKAENLSLDSAGGFYFNNYQEYTRSFEPLFGSWKLKGAYLVLQYDEQKQLRFKVHQTPTGDWMLAKSDQVRLFKAKLEDCEQQ